jgi:hypothetical protein
VPNIRPFRCLHSRKTAKPRALTTTKGHAGVTPHGLCWDYLLSSIPSPLKECAANHGRSSAWSKNFGAVHGATALLRIAHIDHDPSVFNKHLKVTDLFFKGRLV